MKHHLAKLGRGLTLLLFLTGPSACVRANPQLALSELNPGDTALIFLPGFKGSTLRDVQSKTRHWVTLREELFGNSQLGLNLPELGLSNEQEYETDDVLREVVLFPGLLSVDVYRSLLAQFQTISPQVKFLPLAYDWRQDNFKTVLALDAFVSQIRARGVREIVVAAHSMGGIALAYYMRYGKSEPEQAIENWEGAQKISAAIFFGTPFRGAAYPFRNLQFGSIAAFNDKLLHNTAISTFSSVYQMLPPLEERMLISPSGESFQRLIYSASAWQQAKWGIFAGEHETQHASKRYDFLQQMLERAQRISSLINAEPVANAPQIPVLNVISQAHPTFSYVIAQPENLRIFAHDQSSLQRHFPELPLNALDTPGDGVVTRHSANLPSAYQKLQSECFLSAERHDRLWRDRLVQKKILEFLSVAIEK